MPGNTYLAIKSLIMKEVRGRPTKGYWLRIGSATMLPDGKILGTIESIPLNWNGEFSLFPAESREKDEPT